MYIECGPFSSAPNLCHRLCRRGPYFFVYLDFAASNLQVVWFSFTVLLGDLLDPIDAFQTDITHNGLPTKAIDGNPNNNYGEGFCTHTSALLTPWLTVDFGQVMEITNVVLYNRMDCCCKYIHLYQYN